LFAVRLFFFWPPAPSPQLILGFEIARHPRSDSHSLAKTAQKRSPRQAAIIFLIYSLTRIYLIKYIKRVGTVFEIIAEPNRRAILSLLVSSEQSVGDIERQLHMSQPAVSKHLRVLRDAGFVESTVDAQRRLYRLKPEPFQQVDAWLAQFRRFWSVHIDALERYLDRAEPPPDGSSTQSKTKSPKQKTKETTARRKPRP
jgi:DNA-binding transcriptional ArsR family regulator